MLALHFGVEECAGAPAFIDGACTTEKYSNRLRCGEIGIDHDIVGAYLLHYSQEWSWRTNNRRIGDSDQVSRIAPHRRCRAQQGREFHRLGGTSA